MNATEMTSMIEARCSQVQPEVDLMLEGMRAELKAGGVGNSLIQKCLQRYFEHSDSMADGLAVLLADRLALPPLSAEDLYSRFSECYDDEPALIETMRQDLQSAAQRDPAANGLYMPFLFHKGFHALQAHRVASFLWHRRQREDALLISSLCAAKLSVDIHPGARIGPGVFFDHGDGLVIGETAVVGAGSTVLHGVTLGGTGKQRGDRHPKVGTGVLIGAHACILGNIHIGNNSRIGAGAVVLRSVPEGHLAVGTPAINRPISTLGDAPAETLDHSFPGAVLEYDEL
ncbi:serine O-acetyltransferase EpsC [Roseateles sp. DB2]|uniref:serine O-acetyltransferase EpsC n=1 Tax=Roseateles sp. DB2 TaxID=3453717 RepID=UPI003EECB41B